MTTWLVTSTFYPEFERLPKVEPSLILDKFEGLNWAITFSIYGIDNINIDKIANFAIFINFFIALF